MERYEEELPQEELEEEEEEDSSEVRQDDEEEESEDTEENFDNEDWVDPSVLRIIYTVADDAMAGRLNKHIWKRADGQQNVHLPPLEVGISK